MREYRCNVTPLICRIVTSAQSAKNALLRGQEVEVSATLGHLSTQLDVASELGVGPAQTPRDGTTPSSSDVSPQGYLTSPTVSKHPNVTPVMASMLSPIPHPTAGLQPPRSTTGLLPLLQVDQVSGLRRASPTAPINTGTPGTQYLRAEPATADFLNPPVQPPPLIHSHSFPNGHQLPSQLHGPNPSTPIISSPSFAASLGIAHAPIFSSPLATMSVSRPPSPLRHYPLPEQTWAEASATELMMMRAESELALSRRPSLVDGRADGRPVITRSRSISVNKHWSKGQVNTSSNPPSAWYSRPVSSDDDDDEESEDEGPKRTKRRRSSAGKDDAPDPGFINGPMISDDIRRQLDQIFEEFLNRICSDRESSWRSKS